MQPGPAIIFTIIYMYDCWLKGQIKRFVQLSLNWLGNPETSS